MSSRLEAIINDYETTLIHSFVNRIIKVFAIPYITVPHSFIISL